MDRRATLATLLGAQRSSAGKATNQLSATVATVTTLTSGLEPYAGQWGFEQAAHLLRRTTFGATYAQIKQVAEQGLAATLAQLFADQPLPAPPVNPSFTDDPNVPVGETWIDAPYSTSVNLSPYRQQSLRSWQMQLLFDEGISLREKLTLFWHNHFAISDVNDPKFVYRHINLLRSHAWGNFRQLIKDVTIDPAMLRFLNGNQNTNVAPNENYAREVLELFTIGKGPLAGPGDYTNYTEDDVIQMARVLTGWRDLGFNSANPANPVNVQFRTNFHDAGVKQLSARFDNIQIPNMGNQEYAHLIDIIFQKDEVAYFICRKLYRWFVYYVIDDNAEANVIAPMAQLLIANDYNLQPAIEALFNSAHFFDILNMGPMIKNPIDFTFTALRQGKATFPTALAQRYILGFRVFQTITPMDMTYFDPPNVAGWKAYYQEPLYYRTWINATTLQARMAYTNLLCTQGVGVGNNRTKIDPLVLVAQVDDPYDPNNLILQLVSLLFPQPITQGQVDALKDILVPGLPDYVWTAEYSSYEANPTDPTYVNPVRDKLQALVIAMLSMPEFYLS